MRIRLKLKIIDNLFNISHNINELENKISTFYEEDDNLNSLINQTYNSFESLIDDIDLSYFKNDKYHFTKIRNKLKFYDDKSKNIIFPIDNKNIKFVSQLKMFLNNYLNMVYYNLGFFKEIINKKNDFFFEIQVINLQIDKYSLCEDFILKDVLKDHDKLV